MTGDNNLLRDYTICMFVCQLFILTFKKFHFQSNYKESHTYLVKYRHLQNRAISLIRSYVTHVLNHVTEQVLAPQDEPQDQESMDTAYAVYFGKFQAAAPKLKRVISEVEGRAEKNPELV